MSRLVNFGKAVEALKAGHRVSREGWSGKGLFVFMQVPSMIDKGVVPKMQSLPLSVKDEFQERFDSGGEQYIRYSNQLAIVFPDNQIHGWAPSGSDVLSEDWIILNS